MIEFKFLRLKDIAERVAGRPVDITITTMLDDTNKYGVVGIDKTTGKVSILIDASAKSEEAIISVLSHELAHIAAGTDEHGQEFCDKMREINDIFTKEYWR